MPSPKFALMLIDMSIPPRIDSLVILLMMGHIKTVLGHTIHRMLEHDSLAVKDIVLIHRTLKLSRLMGKVAKLNMCTRAQRVLTAR